MEQTDLEAADRAIALLAWEAACERLREALRPRTGYPLATTAEVNAAFANAADRLLGLRSVWIAHREIGPAPPSH